MLNDFGDSNSDYHAPILNGNESILLLGRTDFHIRAFDAASGLEQVILMNIVDPNDEYIDTYYYY